MSSLRFSFVITLAKHLADDAGGKDSTGEFECLYKHPSSDGAIYDIYGAMSTLLDLSDNIITSEQTSSPDSKL